MCIEIYNLNEKKKIISIRQQACPKKYLNPIKKNQLKLLIFKRIKVMSKVYVIYKRIKVN